MTEDASEPVAHKHVTPPPPMDDYEAGLEASIRMKTELHEPLTPEEKRFLARMPAQRQVWPAEFED